MLMHGCLSFTLTEQVPQKDETRSTADAITTVVWRPPHVSPKTSLPPPSQVNAIRLNYVWCSEELPMEILPHHGPPSRVPESHVARLEEVVYIAQRRFHSAHSNVICVTGGRAYLADAGWSDEPAILVFVHHKGHVPLGERRLPKTFLHVPVHVYEGRYMSLTRTAEITSEQPRGVIDRADPLMGGVSIGGLDDASTGTLGGFIWDASNQRVRLLTSEHVTRPAATGRCITQPAFSDWKRSEMAIVRQALRLSAASSSAPTTVTALSSSANERLRSLETTTRWSPEQAQQFTIGRAVLVSKLGDQSFTRNGTRYRIGVDVSLIEYNDSRPLDLSIAIPSVLSGAGAGVEPAIETVVPKWDEPTDEGNDCIIKEGRSTGVTVGSPYSVTASVRTLAGGAYTIFADLGTNTVALRLSGESAVLCRQHLVISGRSMQPSAGDSGSLLYIHRPSAHGAGGRVTPWALLHGVVVSHTYCFAVGSPLEAVMAALGPSMTLLGETNAHLLDGQEEEHTQ